jgi:signal transduction histidine kinase
MTSSRSELFQRLGALFEIPAPDPRRARRRIELMERNTMLGVKTVAIIFLIYSFYFSHHTQWASGTSNTLEVAEEKVREIFHVYIVLNILFALPFLVVARMPLALLQWTVVASSLLDGLMLAGMTLITYGLDSVLYWLFIGLIIRNCFSVPPGFSQLVLNFGVSVYYGLVALFYPDILKDIDDSTRSALDLTPPEELLQLFIPRMLVLWLVAFTGYSVQAFLEKQRLAMEEAAEFAAREGQLHSAGRLAAEFAHQIKNPLAIIRNAAHSLERSMRENRNSAALQIEIIQEEVSHADKVITQIMGYAQLSEGRVEKLDLAEKLAEAVGQVFPPAVPTGIKVVIDLAGPFPPLLMQRGHLSEVFINLLQNAREALGGHGTVMVKAIVLRDQTVEITIADDGPGVPPDKLGRIFEAYFTTKEKGTGLGLAIVKHNVELYGGTIRLESVLGKGAKFIVTFPPKSLPKPFKK